MWDERLRLASRRNSVRSGPVSLRLKTIATSNKDSDGSTHTTQTSDQVNQRRKSKLIQPATRCPCKIWLSSDVDREESPASKWKGGLYCRRWTMSSMQETRYQVKSKLARSTRIVDEAGWAGLVWAVGGLVVWIRSGRRAGDGCWRCWADSSLQPEQRDGAMVMWTGVVALPHVLILSTVEDQGREVIVGDVHRATAQRYSQTTVEFRLPALLSMILAAPCSEAKRRKPLGPQDKAGTRFFSNAARPTVAALLTMGLCLCSINGAGVVDELALPMGLANRDSLAGGRLGLIVTRVRYGLIVLLYLTVTA